LINYHIDNVGRTSLLSVGHALSYVLQADFTACFLAGEGKLFAYFKGLEVDFYLTQKHILVKLE
jgi:hypothetical protein